MHLLPLPHQLHPTLITTLVILCSVCIYLSTTLHPNIRTALALEPSAITTRLELHRLTSYPFLHTSLRHILLNIVVIAASLGRFERTTGSLSILVLFVFGLLTQLPGIGYCLVEWVLGQNVPIYGLSGWAFTLLAIESFKMKTIT